MIARNLRRAFAAGLCLVFCIPSASAPAEGPADPRLGALSAAPAGTPVTRGQTGLHKLTLTGGKAALLYVPRTADPDSRMQLVVMLHGARGSPRHSIDLVRRHADQIGFIILAPASRAATWDIISERRYGADVVSIDRALKQVFAELPVDPDRIAVAGFSDGASYALSLGQANGTLFSRVIAFSPGFMAPGRRQGCPPSSFRTGSGTMCCRSTSAAERWCRN